MLIRIQDGLIVDHTEIRMVKKDTHRGGTSELLEVVYRHPVSGIAETVKLFEQADIDSVYNKIVSHAK